MDTKWNDIGIYVINKQIVLGKINREQNLLIDKSDYKTDECITATMTFMNSIIKDGKEESFISCPYGELIWKPYKDK